MNALPAAFIAGLATSVHCAAMCGPLGCALLGGGGTPRQLQLANGLYHSARLTSYTLIGGLLGTTGGAAAGFFNTGVSRALPWVMALLFLCLAFDLGRYLPRPVFLSGILLRLNLRHSAKTPARTGILLGLATPFLPCGPLYLAFGIALVSGSFLSGAQLMAAFALGTIPLYALAQAGLFRWQQRFSPTSLQRWQRGLALVSALLIGGRAALQNPILTEPIKCLFCH